MSAPATVTPARVLELKAEAKDAVKTQRLKHSHALDAIAQREGYRNWSDLLADVDGGREAVREARHMSAPTEAKRRRLERAARYGGGK